MISLKIKRAVFFTALSIVFFLPTSLFSGYIYEGDRIINEKTLKKLEEMGNELFKKTGVSIVIVAKNHLTQDEFLSIKNRYLKSLKPPYVLWIFSKKYMDRDNLGINKMFSSPDMKEKFDEDSLFSPWGGTFTKVLTLRSKTDTTSAAFLNGFADLTDMIAESYGITLDSSIGSETKTVVNIFRIIFYASILYFLIRYIKIKYIKREKSG